MTLLYGAGAAIGYTVNRNFTFAHNGNVFGSGIRYLITHFLGYLINLFCFVDRLGFPHQSVQAVAIFVVAGFIFIASKFFVFRNPVSSDVSKS